MCPAASMPERFGIRTSISTTSGISSWAFSTASSPSDASPTNIRSSSDCRTISRPRRNKAWSSTIITRSLSAASSFASLVISPGGIGRRRYRTSRESYSPVPPAEAFAVMIAELAFEFVGEVVERGPDVSGLRVRVERLAGNPQRPLDHREPADGAGMGFGDELELQSHHAGLEPPEARQLVLGLLADLVGDRQSTGSEGQIHPAPWPRPSTRGMRCFRPADLVFGPTLACGGVCRRIARRAMIADAHPLPVLGAGLTSKPLHARRPRVALRGSFRPRLASTTGVDPRATTDPDGSTLEYRRRGRGGRRRQAAADPAGAPGGPRTSGTP